MILKDYDDNEYLFKIELRENSLHFWLKEIKVYAPFTFEKSFTLEEIIANHKAFRSCDDLKEIYDHLINLYKKGKTELLNIGANSERIIVFKIDFISLKEQVTKDFVVEMQMTKEKDKDLLELYKIQKEQIAKLEKIKNIVDKLPKEHPLYKEINGIIKEYEKNDNH